MKEDIVDIIVDKIIKYDNQKQLSWTSSYKEILKSLDMENKKDDNNLLINVVKKLTRLGYDIDPIPFKLVSFK